MAALPFTLHADCVPTLSRNAETALELARAGLAVFPCDDSKRPRPGVRWREQSTTDEDAILSFWDRWPDALPAIDLGKSGLLVVDADRHGGPDGVTAWDSLAVVHGFVGADHPSVQTPGGGRHVYFRRATGDLGNSRGALPAGVDVRGAGGYVIGPGAVLSDGRRYLPDGPHPIHAPELPGWLEEILRGRRDDPEPPPSAPVPRPVPSGDRIAAYAAAAFDEEVARVIATGKGGRNHALNAAAFSLGQMIGAGWLGEAEVRARLIEAARANGMIRDDGMPAALKTIGSGINAGRRQPRTEPEDKAAAQTERGAELARRLIEAATGELIDEETGEIIHEPVRADASAFPDHLTRVPGLLGEIVDWIEATARRPSRALALGAAATVVGTALGRRMAGPTMNGTHLYVLCLAPTGAGKDHGLQQVRRLLAAARMGHHIGPDEFMSMPALVNFMVRTPLAVCPMDEFGGFLRRINGKRASGFETSITRTLRTAWGVNYGSMSTPEWAGRAAQPIHAPAVSIYAVSTPEEFYNSLEGGDIINGFLNRFLCFDVGARPADTEPAMAPDVVPQSIADRLHDLYTAGNKLLAAQRNNSAEKPDYATMPWADQGAYAVYRQLLAEVEQKGDRRPELAAVMGRTAEMALRLATIRAGGRSIEAPAIAVDDMEWGRDVALWSANAMHAGVVRYMAENDTEAQANRIIRILEDSGGRVVYRTLLRRLKHRLKSRDLKDLLHSLEESGTIRTEMSVPERGGHPTKWCILNRDDPA